MISPELQQVECERLERHTKNAMRAKVGPKADGVIMDLDISGTTFNRPGIQEVMRLAEAGAIDLVLVWKWNRFGRNTRESLQAIHKLEDLGVQVRAATEDIDTSTAIGEFSRDQLLGLAQLQARQIGEGWQETHRARHRRGKPHTGQPRLGYTYDLEAKSYAPDAVMAPLVADAYRRYLAGETMGSVTQSVSARGLKTVRGKALEQSKLFRSLDSGFAAGLLRVGATEEEPEWLPGEHDPLITPEEWEAYKTKRGSAIKTGEPRRPKHMTSGLMVCDACGGSAKAGVMTDRAKKAQGPVPIFHCAQPKEECAYNNTVRRRIVEVAVWEWIEAQAEGVEEAGAQLVRMAEASSKLQANPREELFYKRAKLAEQRRGYMRMKAAGEMDDEDFAQLKGEADTAIAVVERQLLALPEEGVERPPAEMFSDMLDVLRALRVDQQREVLRTVIRQIRIRPGRLPVEEKLKIVAAWELPAA